MEPLCREVTHLPQWQRQPTIAAAAASRPSSYVRPSAKGVQRDGEATRAHPQCYCPPPPSPPHDPSLQSVSTWHGVTRSLLRPKNKPAEYQYLGGCRWALCAGRAVRGCPCWFSAVRRAGDAEGWGWEAGGGGVEGGGRGGCGIPPRLRNDANLTPRKVTPRRIVFSIARVFSDFPATFPKLLTSVAAFYILLNILLFYFPQEENTNSGVTLTCYSIFPVAQMWWAGLKKQKQKQKTPYFC